MIHLLTLALNVNLTCLIMLELKSVCIRFLSVRLMLRTNWMPMENWSVVNVMTCSISLLIQLISLPDASKTQFLIVSKVMTITTIVPNVQINTLDMVLALVSITLSLLVWLITSTKLIFVKSVRIIVSLLSMTNIVLFRTPSKIVNCILIWMITL